ncbi:MAG: SAM-dependent methyltransferase [Verrucomicrobiae bacterium]|nr:SAM-dependent methyltransferase [Verrucomicrobiae bacterium]
MPADHIREEISQTGAISFARFMELALYCPETGYYEKKKDNVGRQGDFITSVSVGSLFGELLAFQFAGWLDELKNRHEKLQIIEAGAHDGKLAADILNWLQIHRPVLFSAIEYTILEPSPARRQWQQEKLSPFSNVRWRSSVNSSQPPSAGILFSNELLDAFPVQRLGWDASGRQWFEWGVTLDGELLRWSRLPLAASSLPANIVNLPAALLEVLPDQYTIETSPAAESWWHAAAGILSHGKLLAIDYGFTDDEMISPARTKGTLRAYHRHHVTDDVLANPGDQDLTAHVNFSAIQKAGEAAGLRTETFCTQPQFLTRILAKAVPEKLFASMDARQIRQFQTLTHPEHLGRAFRVLVQSR